MSGPASHPDLDLGDSSSHVEVAKAILNSQGFAAGTGNKFDKKLLDAIIVFQGSHVGPDRKPLRQLGRVGRKTWWALYNPEGDAQRAYASGELPDNLPAGDRKAVVEAAYNLWKNNVREIPSGANWGDGVTDVLRHAGGPRPWCAHFVSHAFKAGTGEYPFGKDHGHVLTLWNEAKKRGRAHEKGSGYVPAPGDAGVTLYRNSSGRLTGSGHIWYMIALGPKSGKGRAYNHIGGNEGNRLKLGIRNTTDDSLYGWIDLFGDGEKPCRCNVLPFQEDLSRANESLASTR